MCALSPIFKVALLMWIHEVMEGGELFHQIVKLTYFSENLARHVIMQVAQGIRYLHEDCGVVLE